MPKKIYIRTFGCQMNFRDSEFVQGILMDSGFAKADSLEDADIILFNTCSVRQHAEDRVYANIWNLRKLKDSRPDLVIGVIGCMAQARREKILEDIPLVDFTCGPDNEPELPALIKKMLKERTAIAALDEIGKERRELFPEYRENSLKALVSIGYGCDNFCSYCVVPYVRGRERSRPPKDIIREVKDLVARGFKEITLLGQNVNSYKVQGSRFKVQGFTGLLEEINEIRGDFRLRFITSHPKDASQKLFEAMRDLDKVCEHLHLPLQSGSDRILKLMNRGYNAAKYMKQIDSYRKAVPEGSLTTDIIVGFPSESKEDFTKTRNMMKRIGFDAAFIFKYSPRPFTKAAKLKDDVPEDEKSRRNSILLEMQSGISRERNAALVTSSQEVLFEGRDGGLAQGRTRTNKIVLAPGGAGLVGRFASVRIEDVTCHTLRGTRV